jgi:ferric-dicitrate binding protein FerR (iron transport regulator)
MSVYADTYGEPDFETTSRMRSRIMGYLEERENDRRRVRHWVQAVAVTLVLGVAGVGIWLWQAGGDDRQEATDAAGVLATVGHAQEVKLERDDRVLLLPHSGIRIRRDDGEAAVIELLEGELELRLDDVDVRAVQVRVGSYEIDVHAVRVSVRRTRGVPLVTVHDGSVRLTGPELPADGIQIAPVQ